jgi:hypothetical protein
MRLVFHGTQSSALSHPPSKVLGQDQRSICLVNDATIVIDSVLLVMQKGRLVDGILDLLSGRTITKSLLGDVSSAVPDFTVL